LRTEADRGLSAPVEVSDFLTPSYAKTYVKRNKNDAGPSCYLRGDNPTLRAVLPVKSVE
jgi:hypothetical protein